jgi:hypothetical protein
MEQGHSRLHWDCSANTHQFAYQCPVSLQRGTYYIRIIYSLSTLERKTVQSFKNYIPQWSGSIILYVYQSVLLARMQLTRHNRGSDFRQKHIWKEVEGRDTARQRCLFLAQSHTTYINPPRTVSSLTGTRAPLRVEWLLSQPAFDIASFRQVSSSGAVQATGPAIVTNSPDIGPLR